MRDRIVPPGPREIAEAHLVALADLALWHECLRGLLGPDELAKADRYIPEDKKRESVRCRGFLRVLLAQRLGRDPRALAFATVGKGKPVLVSKSVVERKAEAQKRQREYNLPAASMGAAMAASAASLVWALSWNCC